MSTEVPVGQGLNKESLEKEEGDKDALEDEEAMVKRHAYLTRRYQSFWAKTKL